MGDDDRNTETDLVQRLRLQWGVRCIFRRTSFLATTGPEALALCAATVAALESTTWSPGLALAARRWRTGVSSLAEAASALRCLSETVAEEAITEYGERQPPGLDSVLEQLTGEATSASARRAGTEGVDIVTGCANRLAFETDLEDAVTVALAEFGDVSLAMVEIEPTTRATDVNLVSLAAGLRRALGHSRGLYRVGMSKFAVLLPGEDVTGAGAVMLRATCSGAPRFGWGVAGLRSAGIVSADRADALSMLAEADLHVRRRDYSHARHMLARHRRNSTLAAVAGALVMVAGVTLGIGSAVHVPTGGQSALPAPVTGPPSPSSVSPPLSAPPASSIPAPSPAPATSVPLHGNLVSYVTPAPAAPQVPLPANPTPSLPQLPSPSPLPGPGSGPSPPPLAPLLGAAEQLLNGLVNSLTTV
jgi:GGDEF domain-containing protein